MLIDWKSAEVQQPTVWDYWKQNESK